MGLVLLFSISPACSAHKQLIPGRALPGWSSAWRREGRGHGSAPCQGRQRCKNIC